MGEGRGWRGYSGTASDGIALFCALIVSLDGAAAGGWEHTSSRPPQLSLSYQAYGRGKRETHPPSCLVCVVRRTDPATAPIGVLPTPCEREAE